jgi:hypothetical protein
MKLMKKDKKKYLLITELKEQLFNSNYYEEKDNEITIGKFANYEILAGVLGMEELTLKFEENILDKDLLKKLEGKTDIPSMEFYRKYSEKYGLLADNVPPYYYARVLLEADKKKNVYIGELAYKLFVTERRRIEKLTDKGQIEAFKKILEQTKEVFEEIIEGYEKCKYEEENSYIWTGIGNQKRLLSDSIILGMNNLRKYVESYMETEEEKEKREKKQREIKKELEKKEVEEREKYKEERKELIIKVEKRRARASDYKSLKSYFRATGKEKPTKNNW